jgi:hypothetical protein
VVNSAGTSGDMDAVALKPKGGNPALDLYYQSLEKAKKNKK